MATTKESAGHLLDLVPSSERAPAPPFAGDDPRALYLLQEARLLGQRTQWYLEQHEKLENLGLLASGVTWAFILSLTWTPAIKYLALVPGLITTALFVKSILFTRSLSEAFQYLYELEEEFALHPAHGWVHYFRSRSSRYKRRWRTSFWISLLTFNILVAYFAPLQDLLPLLHPQQAVLVPPQVSPQAPAHRSPAGRGRTATTKR